MVNRIWQHHFGRGIVGTPSNFGKLGEAHQPELLDYLAARFVENGWSIKRMHREIMLSAVYGLSSEDIPANSAVDPDNRLLWRANWQRLDAETLRDSLLFVSGNLDLQAGGPPAPLEDKNKRRAVYGFVSRRKLDSMLALFDFPNPNSTSEQRVVTNVPLQRLYLMNSNFVEDQAAGLAKRLSGTEDERVTAGLPDRLRQGALGGGTAARPGICEEEQLERIRAGAAEFQRIRVGELDA